LGALAASPEAVCASQMRQPAEGEQVPLEGVWRPIRYFHRAAGLEAPTDDEKVKAVLSGIRRTIGAAVVRKKAATSDIVLGMVGARVPRSANFATAQSCCLGSLAHSDDRSSWPLT
jgi:hypothetical protein